MMAATSFLPNDAYSYSTQPQLNNSTEEEDSFCVEDNVTECAGYLSLELEALGQESLFSNGALDVVKMLNGLHGLLQLYRDSVSKIEDAMSTLHRTQSDLNLHWEAQSRIQSELEVAAREIISLREKERQLRIKNKSLTAKLRVECEEGRRLKAAMQSKTQQYCHDLKRKDREYDRLKDRLGQLLTDRLQEKKLGMKLLNGLQQNGAGRRASKTPSSGSAHQQELYEVMITGYEEKVKELLLENSSLREAIANMEKELVSMLNLQESRGRERRDGDSVGEGEEAQVSISHDLFSSGYLQMPFSIVREGIERRLRERYQQIRDYIQMLESDIGLPQQQYDAEMSQLEKKLSDYRSIIDQQEKMLQHQQATESEQRSSSPLLSESRLLQRQELVGIMEEAVKEKGRNIETVQQKMLEAARQLDKEREEFETLRSQFFKDQLLNTSIFACASPNRTTHLDSFYTKLSSTPFPSSNDRPTIKTPSSHDCLTMKTPSSRSSHSSRSPPHRNILAPPTYTKGGVDLNNSISLTSEDGEDILNNV